jgi:hypothetical protein
MALFLCLCAGGSPASAAGFSVQSVFPFGPAHVAVAFSDSVDIASALQASHYVMTAMGGAPAITVQSIQLQDNQRTIILATAGALAKSASYTLTVTGVTSRHGDALVATAPVPWTTPTATIMGIADVHANINNLIGQSVTIIGEVFIREGSVTGSPSGYVQDGTGRGLNVFGTPPIASLDTLGTVVQITGTAALFFTTVELTGMTVVPIASNVPLLAPKVLTAQGASSSQWEGTYIQTTAKLTGPPVVSGANHYNYPASDQGIAFTFRVRNSMGVNPANFVGNEIVTGAGAGSVFSGVYQVTAGVPGDFFVGTGRGDITPPVLVSALGEGGDTRVSVAFSEPVAVGASTVANYTLYPTASPGAPLTIIAASAVGSVVTLTLAAPLVAATSYTLAVSHVQDPSGNEIPAGSNLTFIATTPTPYGVAGGFRFGTAYVGVAFTKRVNASAATQLANYVFSPSLALAEATLQDNGQTVILRAAATLPASTTYSVTVTGVPSATGEPLAPGPPPTLDTGAETVVDIATIQANVSAYAGQVVTFFGQVTIPVGSRGGTPSGYVQDASGHGINLFGNPIQGAVNQLGSVAKITGTVTPYFTTTEVTPYTAVAVATGMPHLGAKRLTIAQANDVAWEGTYIEASGTISSIAASGTSNTGYTAVDGASSVEFRVGNGLGIPAGQFVVGDRVTGRGTGSSFQSTYQINVGNLADFFLAGAAGPDTTGPRVLSITGDDGSPRVVVSFDEPLNSNTATLVANYAVAPTGGVAIPVTGVVLAPSGRSVTLTLASPLSGGTVYFVTVSGVTDVTGNPILPGTTVSFTATLSAPPSARLTVSARTIVRGLSRQGEVANIEAAGPPNSKAVLRVFDLRGRLVRVLFDSRLPANGRHTVTWDARDESFEYVPAGLYVCHLLTTDPAGNTGETRVPIVVAVRLQ